MMRRILVIAIATVVSCLPSISFAEVPWEAADIPPGEILGDPEALGLGAPRSLRGGGARGTFGNPAALADILRNAVVVDGSEGPNERYPMLIPGFEVHLDGGHGLPQAIGYGHSFGRYALGVAFARTFRASFEGQDPTFSAHAQFRIETYGIAGAWKANDWLSLGLSGRVASGTGKETQTGPIDVEREDTQLAYGGSVGARGRWKRFDLALLAEGGTNFKSELVTLSFPETLTAHQPISVRLGGEFELHPLIHVVGEAAFMDRSHYGTPQAPDSYRSTLDGSVGVEVKPGSSSPLLLRAGVLRRTDPFNQGMALVDVGQTFLTGGLGVRTKGIQVDLAVASSHVFEDVSNLEIEQTHWAAGIVVPF